MKNSVGKQRDLSVLDSGEEFFGDFFERIEAASDYILIKQFLWRNDVAGRAVAEKLHEAMVRGVRVIILKDRIGAFPEYAEGDGQSFFHDVPLSDSAFSAHSLSTIYAQANVFVSWFYRNGVKPQERNPMRNQIVEHPNSTVIDDYRLYDHSKVVVIDGKTAYVGGIGFGNEFYGGDQKWSDYMVRVEDEGAVQNLLQVLAGRDVASSELDLVRFHTDHSQGLAGGSLHAYVIEKIRDSREELLIEMPFLGNPNYSDAIAECVRAGVKTCLVLPESAPYHQNRNLHFLKSVLNQSGGSEKLKIVMSPTVVHGKSIVIDQELALLGSHNLHMDRRVLEETILETSNQRLIADVRNRMMSTFDSGVVLDVLPPWREIIVRSRLEYLTMKLQTLMTKLRAEEIARVREICQGEIGELIGLA